MNIVDLKNIIRNLKTIPILFMGLCLTTACSSSREAFDPQKKYAPSVLQEDYTIFRRILETAHPSIYWYTPKDSMDYYFDRVYRSLDTPMTEIQFREQMAYVISRLDCGHTTLKGSKAYIKYTDTSSALSFPYALKFWADTMVITASLRRNETQMRRGTVVTSINGYSARELTDTLFNYITTDGFSLTGKYQSLSTGFTFANLYKNIIGLTDSIDVHYIDSNGLESRTWVKPYDFKADSFRNKTLVKGPPSRDKPKKTPNPSFVFSPANLQLDTVMKTGFMTVSTFDRSNHLKRFFKRSFKTIHKTHINNLIIDVRSNGGGDAGLSTLLTRFIIDHDFKIADSLYTVKPPSEYKKYISKSFWNGLVVDFVTRKEKDGKYHFTYFEKHQYSPKKSNHYDGNVFILIGGNSFSATTLFAGALKGQKNVTLVGEETGGGYYGNTAWIIPDVTLPNTGIRFRLPLFRMVINKERVKNGQGILPDVWALPSVEAIREGIDFKAMKVKELILRQNSFSNTEKK